MLKRLIPALSLVMFGCTPPPQSLTAEGYKHADYDYVIPSAGAKELLGKEWKLDNLYYRKAGSSAGGSQNKNSPKRRNQQAKSPPVRSSGWLTKDGPEYVTTLQIDENDDGQIDLEKTVDTYDLRFKHLRHDGLVFLRTIPISSDQRKKRLSVLLERYLKYVSGAGYSVDAFSGEPILTERRFGAKVIKNGLGRVGGRQARFADIDVVNLDQLKADPDASATRIRLVIAHTKFKYKYGMRTKPKKLPVLFVAGYTNHEGDFEEGLADFHALLDKIQFKGESGLKLPKAMKE